jgi:SAM-dependent methyltransferase
MLRLKRRLLRSVEKGISAVSARLPPTTEFSAIHDVDYRWNLIRPHLPGAPSWLLDVGSNDGDTCRRAAALGHHALGLEISPQFVMRANRRAHPNVAFMTTSVSPDTLSSMPQFDAVFLLSVVHRIWAFEGRKHAEGCVRAAFRKTGLLFFEGVVRHVRYTDKGQPAPEFPDEDLSRGREWHLDWLKVLAPSGWRIDHIGDVHPLNGNAPRLLFVGKQ